MARKPTPNQSKAAELAVGQLMAGEKKPNMSAIAKQVYNTNNPKEMGMQLRRSEGFRTALTEMLDRAGLTKEKLIYELSLFLGDDKEDNIRLQAWDRAAKLHQVFPDEIKKSVQVQVEGGSFFEKLANQSKEAGPSDTETPQGPSQEST